MKALLRCVLGVLVGVSAVACNRNDIEAVTLSNEADQLKGTNLDSAIAKYEQAVNLDPANHRILWKLSAAYAKQEKWDKVALAMSKAEKLQPKNALYWFQHGVAVARQAERGPLTWADAKPLFEEAIRLDPNVGDGEHYGAAHFELAEVFLHMDEEREALAHYTKAIQAKPDNLTFYGPLADLYVRLNLLSEAEEVLRAAVTFGKDGDPGLFVVHSLLGDVADRRRDPQRAVAEYELAKKACGACVGPGQSIAWFNLGAAYATLNPPRKSEALGQLQTFHKNVCRGAGAIRFADPCAQTQHLVTRLGGTLQ